MTVLPTVSLIKLIPLLESLAFCVTLPCVPGYRYFDQSRQWNQSIRESLWIWIQLSSAIDESQCVEVCVWICEIKIFIKVSRELGGGEREYTLQIVIEGNREWYLFWGNSGGSDSETVGSRENPLGFLSLILPKVYPSVIALSWMFISMFILSFR